jgi:hypothetical protein
MQITSVQYYRGFDFEGNATQENVGINAIIDGRKLSVPLDPSNRHYAEIMRQVEAGTLTIQEAE